MHFAGGEGHPIELDGFIYLIKEFIGLPILRHNSRRLTALTKQQITKP